MLDRFNVGTVIRDHSRSMTDYNGGGHDRVAKLILWGLPLVIGGVVIYFDYRLASPTAFVPATSLLAGILFGAVGQLISIRARIADSVLLSKNERLKSHIRESVSGMLLAALTAMVLSVLLGALILIPIDTAAAPLAHPLAWSRVGIGVTACVGVLGTYMVLLFIISTRRLYASYLEAFENGRGLPRVKKKTAPAQAAVPAKKSTRPAVRTTAPAKKATSTNP